MLRVFPGILAALLILDGTPTPKMPWVVVAQDKKGFVLGPSGKPFSPWGFNYDHDHQGRLLEDYWEAEWAKVERDFQAMKKLGAKYSASPGAK